MNFIGAYAFYQTGLTSATFEDTTTWKLENDVKLYSGVGKLEYVNLGYTSAPASSNNNADVNSVSISIASESVAANALKGALTVTVSSLKFDSSKSIVYCYTENWIKS